VTLVRSVTISRVLSALWTVLPGPDVGSPPTQQNSTAI
jgi:hypothetical protein